MNYIFFPPWTLHCTSAQGRQDMEERYIKEKTTAARAFGHLLYMNYLFMGKVLAQLSSSSSMPCLSCTLIGSSSHTRNQSWARDNTAATTCRVFRPWPWLIMVWFLHSLCLLHLDTKTLKCSVFYLSQKLYCRVVAVMKLKHCRLPSSAYKKEHSTA